jgi:Outer membrane protein beta-barrel domain
MKKLILSLLIMITAISVLNAQFTKVGGGMAFTTSFNFNNTDVAAYRSGHFGVFVKGIYEINTIIHISPSYTIFFPHVTKEGESRLSISSMMFDINGHYVFNSLDRFEFYALLGPDILLTGLRSKSTGFPTFKERDNALGLNIGVGTYAKLTEQFDLSGEIKYVLSKYDQFMLNVGILINLDWLIKHEKPGK